jgi:hypothetical protein
MNQLKETVNTFTNWVNDRRLNAAVTKWQPQRGTQKGQLEILHAAQSGETTAVDYLFLTFTKLVAKVFWVYYIGPDKKYAKGKITAGEDEEFASMAYTMLAGKEELSPYKTFDPSKFSEDADLIKQFGYYYYRYLQRMSMKMSRANKMEGMAGNVKDNAAPQTVDYDSLSGTGEEPSTPDSFTAEVDMKETLRVFLGQLKQRDERYYKIFKSRLAGNSIPETAKKLSVTAQTVRNDLKVIQDMYKEFVGE